MKTTEASNRVDKKLSGGGKDQIKLDIKQFIKLADKEREDYEVDNMLLEALRDKFQAEKKPGESYSEWIKRTPKKELLQLQLKEGGKVIKFSDYYKIKEPKAVKKISLSDVFDTNRTVESLSPTERDSLRYLLSYIFND